MARNPLLTKKYRGFMDLLTTALRFDGITQYATVKGRRVEVRCEPVGFAPVRMTWRIDGKRASVKRVHALYGI